MAKPAKVVKKQTVKLYQRFSVVQRVEHFLFLVTFTLLAITGLSQKYSTSFIAIGVFKLVGGVETARLIHHIAAIIMSGVSGFHVIEVGYRLWVDRIHISMIPWTNDLLHVIHDIKYYFGFKKKKAYYGRYSYAEKMEYLALIWGTIVMGITGLMMWNPISTVRFLPGEAIPAAKAAHGGEAVLAVLAIVIWHFYHVHIKIFNKSMFTGKLNRHEMEHEHPAELALIDKGEQRPPEVRLRTKVIRQIIYIPVAIGIVVATAGTIYFALFTENTAVASMPAGESVTAYAPLPTPTLVYIEPTPMPRPTDLTWNGFVGPTLQLMCVNCHRADSVSGLDLSNLQSAISGGKKGPGFVSGDPNQGTIISNQIAGGHPGQLTKDQIKYLSEWVSTGMP